ncbi:unnamed protein product [Merluccius merluccius]
MALGDPLKGMLALDPGLKGGPPPASLLRPGSKEDPPASLLPGRYGRRSEGFLLKSQPVCLKPARWPVPLPPSPPAVWTGEDEEEAEDEEDEEDNLDEMHGKLLGGGARWGGWHLLILLSPRMLNQAIRPEPHNQTENRSGGNEGNKLKLWRKENEERG